MAQLRGRGDNGGSRGRLDLGLLICNWCGGRSRRGGLSGLSDGLSRGVLERSNGGGLLDLRGVLLNLSGGADLSLGLRLEEVADARRQTASDLGSLGLLLLLLFLLLLNL